MTTKDFQKLHDEMHALREGEQFDKLMEYFTDDCCMMSPMHDPCNKKQMVELHAKGGKPEMKGAKKTVHCDSVALSGDLAIERGTGKITCPNGTEKGIYYLCVWRNEGGKWKIFNACFAAKAGECGGK